MKLLRWRTRPRHIRKYGYAAQPAWHVCILCYITSMYIDPGFAQLLAFINSFYHSVQLKVVENFSSTVINFDLHIKIMMNLIFICDFKMLCDLMTNLIESMFVRFNK